MRYKTDRLVDEYKQLWDKNPRLCHILIELDQFCIGTFGKDIMITSIYRSPEEQAEVYKNSPIKVPNSPHTVWEGVDLRSTDWTLDQKGKMLKLLNQNVVYGGRRRCAMVHAITGNVDHFHIQCDKESK